MSQRVFLLCIKPDVLRLFIDAVSSSSDSAFDYSIEQLRARSAPQVRANAISRRHAARLDRSAFEKAGRIDEYHLIVSVRPYAITGHDPTSVRQAVHAVRFASTDQALERIFQSELARLEGLTKQPGAEAEEYDDWPGNIEDIRRLRGMRIAAQSNTPFIITVNKTAPFGDGGMTVVLDEVEQESLSGTELAIQYGYLLGATLGRIAGLCEPSWWLGRNFWLGLMIAERFSLIGKLTKRRLISLSERMAELASGPAGLFDEIAVDGFVDGFPLLCESYSSGLLFGPDTVGVMRDLMTSRKADWIALASRATGYEESITTQLFDVVLEAFDWAASEGCALMEGDDLVGSMGYR